MEKNHETLMAEDPQEEVNVKAVIIVLSAIFIMFGAIAYAFLGL